MKYKVVIVVANLLWHPYLSAERHAVGANGLTESLTECLPKCLQTLNYILSWVHSAILLTGQYGCQTITHNGQSYIFLSPEIQN